jgi:hypothetical protein
MCDHQFVDNLRCVRRSVQENGGLMEYDYPDSVERRPDGRASEINMRGTTLHTPARSPDPLTERSRAIWNAGDDDDRISTGFRHEAKAFVAVVRDFAVRR